MIALPDLSHRPCHAGLCSFFIEDHVSTVVRGGEDSRMLIVTKCCRLACLVHRKRCRWCGGGGEY